MSVIIKISKWLLTLLALLVLTIYFGRAFYSLNLPDLGTEYRIEFDHEFEASQEKETDWQDYLAIEERLAKELYEKIPGAERADNLVDRYSADSLTFPGNFDSNWNRSYEMTAASPHGVAVLLHGLTDSPYSMLSTAQVLAGAGYSVVVPRMPGHGFAVGGLLQARWEDWGAAIRIAVRHAMRKPGADEFLLLVGYSNGGLMAIDYALRCGERDNLACPDALVLLSPSIDVSPLAAITNLHSAISWLPFFEKFQWESILPEVDPFKFTSFPKRAAWEIFRILRRTHKALAQPGEVARLPPILTFQSVVDNTVSARAIVTRLYARLPANGSRLVVYDVNSNSTLLHLMKGEPVDPSRYFLSIAPQNFGVTVLRNRNSNSLAVDVLTLPAGRTDAVVTQTPFEWPRGIFSLSHIALPFQADDQVYGNGEQEGDRPMIAFGALAPRGERGVMRLNAEYFLRMRYNPFFSFQQAQMTDWLDSLRESSTTETEHP